MEAPPAGNYMFKVNNRNTITKCEICSKFTIKTPYSKLTNKTPERDIVLVSLLLTWNIFHNVF